MMLGAQRPRRRYGGRAGNKAEMQERIDLEEEVLSYLPALPHGPMNAG